MFGMGTGIPPPPWPPGVVCLIPKAPRACPGLLPSRASRRPSSNAQGILTDTVCLPENDNMVKPHDLLVLIGSCIAAFIPSAYRPGSLPGVFRRVIPSVMIYLEVGFPLRCFQRLSLPNLDTRHLPLAGQPVHQRFVHLGPLVLKAAPLRFPALITDRDRTVSRRSEPSSRTALIGEQPNPWDLLQPQDAMSRHRGAKPSRRCELLGKISLLSPEYLLSVK